MNRKLLALYGLKWNPFAPDVPVEALHVGRSIESFCWRAEQLVGEGGFALVTGAPGAGKSVTLRILADPAGGEARREGRCRQPSSVGPVRPSIASWATCSASSCLATIAGPAPWFCPSAGGRTSTPLCRAPCSSPTRRRR